MHHELTEAEQLALFERWLRLHQGLVFKVVRSLEADPDYQQDLFQEILLQLWSSAATFSGQCSETTWIYRVALNTAYTWCRNENRRRGRLDRITAYAERAVSEADEGLDSRRQLEALYAAIRQLSKPEASLIIMHLDGMSGRDMAEVTGLTENHVGVKLSRARKRLYEILKEQSA